MVFLLIVLGYFFASSRAVTTSTRQRIYFCKLTLCFDQLYFGYNSRVCVCLSRLHIRSCVVLLVRRWGDWQCSITALAHVWHIGLVGLKLSNSPKTWNLSRRSNKSELLSTLYNAAHLTNIHPPSPSHTPQTHTHTRKLLDVLSFRVFPSSPNQSSFQNSIIQSS